MKIEDEMIESIQEPHSEKGKKFLNCIREKGEQIHILTFAELVNDRIFATFKVGEDDNGDIEALLISEPGKKNMSISTSNVYLSIDDNGDIDCNVNGNQIETPFPFDTDQETFFGLMMLHDYADLGFKHIELFRDLFTINSTLAE